MKWEYKSIRGMTNYDLNTLGKEGWELVAVSDWYFYFKRQLRVMREISQMEQLGG